MEVRYNISIESTKGVSDKTTSKTDSVCNISKYIKKTFNPFAFLASNSTFLYHHIDIFKINNHNTNKLKNKKQFVLCTLL